MKMPHRLLLILVSVLIGGVCAWILRGEYDRYFMMEGHFHVVSTATQDHEVVLEFPSGEQVQFSLNSGSTFDFTQRNTGEGSITVVIDGVVRDQVGYVTSANSIVVLVIGNENTSFSQIFPSL